MVHLRTYALLSEVAIYKLEPANEDARLMLGDLSIGKFDKMTYLTQADISYNLRMYTKHCPKELLTLGEQAGVGFV